jgi:hypothetical protein
MLGAMLFLLMLLAPMVALMLYLMLRRGWPYQKLIPYLVVHGTGVGAVLGIVFELRGVHLVAAAGIGELMSLTTAVSWGWGIAQIQKANSERERERRM